MYWFYLTVSSCLIIIGGTSPSPPCPTLSALPGTVVLCTKPTTNETIDCLDSNVEIPRGTIAKYKCERGENFSENILKCRCKGRWRGLMDFNHFMSKCNISDYSFEGPPELNITEQGIKLLALEKPEPTNVTDYQEDGVAYHNFYRKIHHSPPLQLNTTLCDAAQKWADHVASESSFQQQPWKDRWYSQIMYRILGSGIDPREAVRLAVAAWYQGAYNYDYETPSGPSAFTQVVWKSTTDLGIGVAQKDNNTVVVADYWPPGNVVVVNPDLPSTDRWAWFTENVQPPNLVNATMNTQINSQSNISSTTEIVTTTQA